MTRRIKRDIIDNAEPYTMQKILNSEIPSASYLDISTGYFNVQGYGMLRENLESAAAESSFELRLLLGKEAIVPSEKTFEEYAKQHKESVSLKASLEDTDLDQKSMNDTSSLIKLLERQNIHVRQGTRRFNHSKCYILGDNAVFVGSSNFTAAGMVGNYELNAGLYQPGISQTTRNWFDRMWEQAKDTKQELIDTLKESKFGVPPSPYEVYMKMLFERFKPLVTKIDQGDISSKTLTKFQQDAVRTGLFIISDHGGTIIADATGLGKTNIGIEILRQKVLKEGKKILLIAPSQVLHSMWEEKLKEVDINIREKLTMESLGREKILDELIKYKNIDLVLIDESQNFRSKSANRRKNLMKLMSIGKRKQIVLLSATPINNSLMDLYYQLSIITGGEDAYFYKTIGIPDLYKHMRDAANSEGLTQGLTKIQQLLDTVMVRRTRSYIKDVYRDDTISGREIKFPKHSYAAIEYSLSELYGNVFEEILDKISKLTMAPYGIELYNTNLTEDEKRKHRIVAHLQVILLLKRFESSVAAGRTSIENKVMLYKQVKKILDEGKILRVRDFNKIITKWNDLEQGNDSEVDPDDQEKTQFFIDEINSIEKEEIHKSYDIQRLKADIDQDLAILEELLDNVKRITLDTKIDEVIKRILREKALETESKKVLIFTEYVTTAKYITKELEVKFTNKKVECITGSTRQNTRKRYIREFSPKANLLEGEEIDSTDEIDILVSTEVLAEGQNLQDCNYVINYDLPWNPMRIVQRTGRVDRLTSEYDIIHTRACYPDKELDNILKLLGKLLEKIDTVNQTVGLDSEVLGETPTPKQFNGTIKDRIKILAGKDGTKDGTAKVIEDMERESDVMPAASPINELSRYIKEKGVNMMEDVPMGRRSGKQDKGQYAILAYLQERPERRVYFVVYDCTRDSAYVPDDDFEAINMTACDVDTPIHLPMDGSNNQESFEMLLDIDKKARRAIDEKNDQITQYVKSSKNKKRKQHDKNITEISKIILDATINGKITKDEGKDVSSIIKSEYLRSWQEDIREYLSEYNRSQDIDGLVKSIKKMSNYIGLQEKTEPIKDKEDIQRSELKLIGAMFITEPEKPNSELTKFQ